MRWKCSVLVGLMALAGGAALLAQSPTYKLGRTPTADEMRTEDIAIGPEGKELPPGSGTAKEGAALFAQKCSRCHGANGQGSAAGPVLIAQKGGRSPGTYYPYATTMWDYINRTMPWKEPPSLTADNVYALTAFLLFKNGVIQEDTVMDAKSLAKVQMPNRNGFIYAEPWKPGLKKPFGVYP